jgi:hypothetical protein
MSKPHSVTFTPSEAKGKKLKARFFDKDGKKILSVNFGSSDGRNFTDHKDEEIKKNWIARHEVRGTFEEPMSASSLSRWILWNKPTITASIKDYKKRFNLK